MTSPYRNVLDEHDGEKIRNQNRWHKTIKFILAGFAPEPWTIPECVDIGDRSVLTKRLEGIFRAQFTNTDVDLDVDLLFPPKVAHTIDIITCFEVIEHLFNPLFCLLEMKRVLKPNGRIYLSTPRFKPHFLWGNHFHEMSDKSLFALIDRAGLKIVRKQKIFVAPWRSLLTGFRPWLRLVLDRHWLLEIEAY